MRDIDSVAARLTSVHGSIWGDGWTGAGKTSLGNILSSRLSRTHCDMDGLLLRRTGRYAENIDMERLRDILWAAPTSIISGVCARAIQFRVGARPTFNIYVQRMAAGCWADEDDAMGNTDYGCEPSPLILEMRAYHRQWLPHETADLVIERHEEP